MSSKKTFQAKTFAANTFACGTFRGVGASNQLAGRWTNIIEITAHRSRIELTRGPRAEAK